MIIGGDYKVQLVWLYKVLNSISKKGSPEILNFLKISNSQIFYSKFWPRRVLAQECGIYLRS